MEKIERLFANNHAWATKMKDEQSDYFKELAEHQKPTIYGLAVPIVVCLLKNSQG